MRSLRLPDTLKLSPKQAKLNNKVQQRNVFILDLFKILYVLKIWEDTVGEGVVWVQMLSQPSPGCFNPRFKREGTLSTGGTAEKLRDSEYSG